MGILLGVDVGCGHSDKVKLVLWEGNLPCLFWASRWTAVGSGDGLMGVVFLLFLLFHFHYFWSFCFGDLCVGGMALTSQVVSKGG